MKTTIKTRVTILMSIFALILTIGSVLPASSQSRAVFQRTADNLKDYYYGPVRNGNYIYSMYTTPLDLVNDSQETIGAAILGGLVMSYAEASRNDYIGVIIVNTANEAIAMTMESNTLKKFTEGRITADELFDRTTQFTIKLTDIPELNTGLTNVW